MATKTISLELDAYDKLQAAKRPGESFSGYRAPGAVRSERLHRENDSDPAAKPGGGAGRPSGRRVLDQVRRGCPDGDPIAVARRRMKLVDTGFLIDLQRE